MHVHALAVVLVGIGAFKGALSDKPDDGQERSVDACPASDGNRCGVESALGLPGDGGAHKRLEVDMIIVVEAQGTLNASRTRTVTEAIGALIERSCRPEYEDFDVRYALLVYTADGGLYPVQTASPVCTPFDRDRLLHAITTAAPQTAPTVIMATADDPEAIVDRITAERTLSIIASVIDGSGVPEGVERRPNADLHVVIVTDLEVNNAGAVHPTPTQPVDHKFDRGMARVIELAKATRRVAFRVFLDGDNPTSTAVFGDPRLSANSRYADCTHHNRAAALKALIRAEPAQASSLEAHLLALGFDVDVFDLGDLNDTRCVLASNPSLWTGLGLEPQFIDKCPLGARQCPGLADGSDDDDTFCSPLHGCSRRNPVKDGRPTADATENSPATLATFFEARSHADLQVAVPAAPLNPQADAPILSIMEEPWGASPPSTLTDRVIGQPRALLWHPDKPFVQELVRRGEPAVVVNSVVQSWPAVAKWNLSYLMDNVGADVLRAVKCSNAFLTFDPDSRAPLKLNLTLPFVTANMPKSDFFHCVQHPEACTDGFRGHYYFTQVPEGLRKDLVPDEDIYLTEEDYNARKQFMWVSSAGMITHGHFDQDYNVFVQLVGEKRFTLWEPSQHEMLYPYPRVHPMWHKSRVNFAAPDVGRFPQFAKSRALQVTLTPGMVLFVPPYTWHYVETLTPSVSLSTWSHDYNLYNHMNAIYKHDHNFDLLQHARGQMFALRLYLDMMIHELYGFNQTTAFFVRLLATRYSGLEDLFPPDPQDQDICSASVKGKIPTCHHTHGYAKLDTAIIAAHFAALSLEVRDILFQDYVEEMVAQVVGVKRMLAFFRYCFLGQEYYVTQIGEEEHLLWDHRTI